MSEKLELVGRPNETAAKPIKAVHPVGTPEALRQHGLDPAQYGSCARKDLANGILGCAAFEACRLPKDGVKRFAIRVIKSNAVGGGMAKADVECFTAVVIAEQARVNNNGTIVDVIGHEGDEYDTVESVPVKDSLGRITSYEARPVRRKVAPFPKIGENRELLKDALAGAERRKHEDEQEALQRESALASAGANELLGAPQTETAKPQKPERK